MGYCDGVTTKEEFEAKIIEIRDKSLVEFAEELDFRKADNEMIFDKEPSKLQRKWCRFKNGVKVAKRGVKDVVKTALIVPTFIGLCALSAITKKKYFDYGGQG